eukprot:UN06745
MAAVISGSVFFEKKKTELCWDVNEVFSMSFKDFYMIFCAKES